MEFTAQLASTHLADLGWNSFFESYFAEFKQPGLLPARVVEEFKGFYRVRTVQESTWPKLPASCNILRSAGKICPPSGTGLRSQRVPKKAGRASSTSCRAGPSSPAKLQGGR